jgi:iron complex transport system ATP-binding protein
VKVTEILDRLGIAHLRHRPFPELSGGEQQIALIARVLAQEPRIILLDEPTSHLDVSNQSLLLELLRDVLDWGLTVVAVLHDPNAAFLYGDGFTCLRGGRVLEPDPGRDVGDPTFLEQLYGVEMMAIPFSKRTFVLPLPRRC